MAGLLGITGLAGSGKSTSAQVLIDAGWHRVKFAGPLKAMMRAIGLTDDHIEGALKETPCDMLSGKTPRYAMQTLGTEWGRNCIHPDLWIDLARREIIDHMSRGISVVVDDVRFNNEAALINELGGMVLLIDRGLAAGDHVSENGVAPNITFQNNHSADNLRAWIDYVFLRTGVD